MAPYTVTPAMALVVKHESHVAQLIQGTVPLRAGSTAEKPTSFDPSKAHCSHWILWTAEFRIMLYYNILTWRILPVGLSEKNSIYLLTKFQGWLVIINDKSLHKHNSLVTHNSLVAVPSPLALWQAPLHPGESPSENQEFFTIPTIYQSIFQAIN